MWEFNILYAESTLNMCSITGNIFLIIKCVLYKIIYTLVYIYNTNNNIRHISLILSSAIVTQCLVILMLYTASHYSITE